MGGDITVESTPGEGSTFTAQLQLTPEPPARNAKPAAPVLPCRVLLAFDHMIERQGLADILSGAVASVVQSDLSSAADLAQACAEQGRPFDRVIVDVGSDPVAAGRLLANVSGLSGGNRVVASSSSARCRAQASPHSALKVSTLISSSPCVRQRSSCNSQMIARRPPPVLLSRTRIRHKISANRPCP